MSYSNQMHVSYRDNDEMIQDAWYDGSNWNLQQLNGGGLTNGPAAVGNPDVAVYGSQFHACYRDDGGLIRDAWYNGQNCNVPGYPDQALMLTGHFAGEMAGRPEFLSGTDNSVMYQIDLSRPISIGIYWNGGGGHNPAINGYDDSNPAAPTIDIQDPIYGPSTQDFNSFPSCYRAVVRTDREKHRG